jgi:hypothetical protein
MYEITKNTGKPEAKVDGIKNMAPQICDMPSG